jgi:lipid-A-disaccharide synthase
MRDANVQMLEGFRQLDLVGLIGPRALRAVIQRVVAIRRFLRHEDMDLVVLIDNPGMNFHFARIAKQAGHRVVYYVTPQLWAWRPRRMSWMQRRVDHAVVILPFEAQLYREAGVPCTFVGHPLLDEMATAYDRDRIRAAYGLTSEERVLGLLPGSRRGEVRALLPLMLKAVTMLERDIGPLRLILAVADTVNQDEVKQICEEAAVPVHLIAGDPNGVMAAADLLFIASGTATLQAALVGTPMVIVYKMPWISYLVARALVRGVRSIGLANLIAGRPFIPELIQRQATPEHLAAAGRRILQDHQYRDAMRAEMSRVKSLLGSPGASKRAATVILDVLERREARA